MDAKHKQAVDTLLDKASNNTDAVQAMNFAQAACNAANAARLLTDLDRGSKSPQS